MITLLNFIDTGFIITLGLLILLCGGIMLYSYRRLNILENSIIEHGKILQNFIFNYNNQLNKDVNIIKKNFNKSLDNHDNDNTNDNDNTYNKINVSDDEDENDNDTDNDSDNDSDNTNDTDKNNDDTDDDTDLDDDTDDDDCNDNSDDEKNNNQSDKITISNKIENKDLIDINEALLIDDDEEFNLTADSKIINLENNPESNNNENTLTNPKKNINKMKVDELRTLVVTNNLTDNNTAITLKKSDLLKLLQ